MIVNFLKYVNEIVVMLKRTDFVCVYWIFISEILKIWDSSQNYTVGLWWDKIGDELTIDEAS